MKKIISSLLLVSTLILTGCKEDAVAVKMHFPNVPEDLLIACPDLKTVDANTDKLSVVIGVVADNYSQYHQCRLQVDNWIEWYKIQKEIFDKADK